MFGNLISNHQLKQLMSSHSVDIEPFDELMLKATHYTLQPGRVLRRRPDGKWCINHYFSEEEVCELRPCEYVVVEVRQRIRIHAEGIVGRFLTTSNLVENGLLLVAGQIDHKYGIEGEMLRFGIKNLLPEPNFIRKDTRLAHVEFFDLRGINIDSHELSAVEREIWNQRKQDPDYK